MSQWSEAKLARVRAIWGMGVGSLLVLAAVVYLPDLLAEGLTRDELLLAVLFVGVGIAAASPSFFFQLIGRVVEAWQARKGGE